MKYENEVSKTMMKEGAKKNGEDARKAGAMKYENEVPKIMIHVELYNYGNNCTYFCSATKIFVKSYC